MVQAAIIDNEKTEWMPCPNNEVNYPGLAYLCPLNELIVAQRTDAYHELIGTSGIDYTIFNNLGQKVFLATRKGQVEYEIKIFNYYGNEVMRVKRPPSWCVNKVLIWAPPGNFVGSVRETKAFLKTYHVKNNVSDKVLKIKAKGLLRLEFDVFSSNEVIGLIANRWRVAVSFPVDMNVQFKCILLGACFLVYLGKGVIC